MLRSYPFQVFRHKIYLPMARLFAIIQDLWRGVRTEKTHLLQDLGLDPSIGVHYESISYRKLNKLLKIPLNYGFDSFLDLGCGKGRAIIVAHEVGFKKLWGIDISSILLNEAEQNLNRLSIYANLICSDVSDYTLPNGKLCIFLFNPFGAERISKLYSHLLKRNSETFIIYHNPKHSYIFDEKYKVHEVNWKHFGLYDETANLYLLSQDSTEERN